MIVHGRIGRRDPSCDDAATRVPGAPGDPEKPAVAREREELVATEGAVRREREQTRRKTSPHRGVRPGLDRGGGVRFVYAVDVPGSTVAGREAGRVRGWNARRAEDTEEPISPHASKQLDRTRRDPELPDETAPAGLERATDAAAPAKQPEHAAGGARPGLLVGLLAEREVVLGVA